MRLSGRLVGSILLSIGIAASLGGPGRAQPAASAARARHDKRGVEPQLEQVFADPTYQLTGVAVSAKGRLFTSYPIGSSVHQHSVVEVVAGQARPYPDAAMNSWKPGEDGTRKWVSVQAVYIDDKDKLWVVDAAAPELGEVYRASNKLVRIDLATNQIERSYFFKVIPDNKHSYLNDVRVDTAQHYAYLTSSSLGGIVVVNLKTGDARMVLADTPFVRSDPAYHFTIDGKEVAAGGKPLKVSSDGIALSPDRAWLYFKPLTDDKLYRVKTADLRDPKLVSAELAGRVEDLGHVVVTDGMELDRRGNLYAGDLEHGAIVRFSPDRKTRTVLIKDDRLVWPDSYSISRDGYLYISTSQIHTAPPFNDGVDKRTLPYGIFRLKLPG